MIRNIKKGIVLAVGIIFLILGLFGLVLPFLQGFIFLAIGIVLVSFCFPEIRLWVNRRTEHYPHLSSVVNKIEKWVMKLMGEN